RPIGRAEITNAAGTLMLDQRIDDRLDGRFGVVGMKPIKVDLVDPEVVEALTKVLGNVLRRDAIPPISRAEVHRTALGRNDHFRAVTALQPGAQGAFAGTGRGVGNPVAIGSSGVEKIAAKLGEFIEDRIGSAL